MDADFDTSFPAALQLEHDEQRVTDFDIEDTFDCPEAFDPFFAEDFEKATIGYIFEAQSRHADLDIYDIRKWRVSFSFKLNGSFEHKPHPTENNYVLTHEVSPPSNDEQGVDDSFGVRRLYLFMHQSDTMIVNPYNFHLYTPNDSQSETPYVPCNTYLEQGKDWFHHYSDIGKRQQHFRELVDNALDQIDHPVDEDVRDAFFQHYLTYVLDDYNNWQNFIKERFMETPSTGRVEKKIIRFAQKIETYYDISLAQTDISVQLLKSELDSFVYQVL